MNRPASMQDAMHAAGLNPPDDLYPDGKIHRFASNGRPTDRAGWYWLADDRSYGNFGCWRQGINEPWSAKPEAELSPAERQRMQEGRRKAAELRQAEEARDHANARAKAQEVWRDRPAAGAEHPYLKAKGVQPHGAKLLAPDDRLAIPLMDTDGTVHSLQFIAPDGEKRFLTGGQTKGLFYLIGGAGPVVCIAEGFASAATVHETTGLPVAVAFYCGNLEPVALALRKAWPDVRLVFAADDDWKTEGNPGRTAAQAAADAVGGVVAVPVFAAGRADKATDFNDLAKLEGAEAVRRILDAASKTTAPKTRLAFQWFRDTPEEAPEWLWQGHILRKSAAVLGGKQGLGKGFITVDIAARLSKGLPMPDGTGGGKIGATLIITREDDPHMALKARLRVAGADMLNVAWSTGDIGADDVFSAAANMRSAVPFIEQMVTEHALDLVIVDPLGAWVEDDSNSASQIRAVIDPMSQMARRTGCAVLFVAHIRKAAADDPMDAFAGSFAVTAAVRTAMMVSPLNDKERLLAVVKSNFRKPAAPMVWSLSPADMSAHQDEPPVVFWRPADDFDQAAAAAGQTKGQSPIVDPGLVREHMHPDHKPFKEVARAIHKKLMPVVRGIRLTGVEDAIVQLVADGQAFEGTGRRGIRTVGLASAKPIDTATDKAIRAWEELGANATVRAVADRAQCSVGMAQSSKRHAVFSDPCSVADDGPTEH
jgi:putative DNA primase/helicase